MDKYRWQFAQGRFFVHQYSGKLFRNAELGAMKSILVLEDVRHELQRDTQQSVKVEL